MKTPQEYFVMGADAMQGKIVAWLVSQGYMEIAPKILGLQPPPFSEPEKWAISEVG